MKIGGKVRDVRMNGFIVSVITPKRRISYEDGEKRIDAMISRLKKHSVA